MTKYESQIKTIAAPVERVYARLSDLNNLSVIQERLSDPNVLAFLKQQAAGKVSDEQLATLQERIKTLQFDADSVSGYVEQLGTQLTLRIIEREEPKLVKMQLEGSPVPGTLWLQLLPSSDGTTRMKLTVGVELNFFMRKMIEGKLKTGSDKLADMLAMIPY